MDAAGVDSWIVLCRENNNDPLARHIGGDNAGKLTAFLFQRVPTGIALFIVAPATEIIALRESLPYAVTVPAKTDADVFPLLATRVKEISPRAIAVNKGKLAAADGLTATQQDDLRAALGLELSTRLRSSEELVVRWLAVKTPEEIAIMRRAAALTNLLEYEALDAIVPGKTTNGDLQDQMRARLTALGFGDAWTDNPGIQSGLDRGRGSDAKRLMIPGDVIDIDFGIKVHGMWCTDVQRFAYILMPGEHEPPQQIRYAWESARQSSRRMRAAMRPGVKGWEIDKVQIDWMLSRGSLLHPFRTGHPVGYWAHDVGPSISGYTPEGPPPTGDAARAMEPGMTFSFDGNYVWPATDGPDTGTRSITSEEMAVITATGAEYLSPVQETLVVIPTRR
jgi:Xaa-Pro aminopeptidase